MLIKKLLEFISEKELQKTNQKEFRIEKVLTKNRNNLYAKWKGYDNKDIVQNESVFHKSYEPFGGDINVNIDLSNYATKTSLKEATEIDTSNPALEWILAKLKAEADKKDEDKLKVVPVG